jgi:hypothetical protein
MKKKMPVSNVSRGFPITISDTVEAIALECLYCKKLFKRKTYRKHRCLEKMFCEVSKAAMPNG